MADEQPQDGQLVEGLKALLVAMETSATAVLPSSNLDLLQSIVDAAARIFAAASASICLVNESERLLEFKVAYGDGQGEVVGLKIPIDQGIAGYVAMTGQPIAISDVRQDPRFNQDFAESTGYVPNSILATPLISGDKVIGVMEVLDKISAPSFGMQDMELLGIFAHQAALAIDQSQQYDRIGLALQEGIRKLVAEGEDPDLEVLAETLEDDPFVDEAAGADLAELATLFNEISQLGEIERAMCIRILRAFAEYARAAPEIRF